MASISKPPGKKTWIIQFYYQGKKYRKSLKVANRRDALLLKQMIERKLAEGTFDPALMLQQKQPILHLSDLLDKWERHLQRRNDLTPRTREGYLLAARVLAQVAGNPRLTDFTPAYIKDHLLLELDDRYESAGTIKNKMVGFRVMFSFAERNGYIPKNPFAGQVPGYQRKKPVFFREEEIKRLIEYFSDPARPAWQRTYFLTLLNTGNRKTEHFKLKWSENIFLEEKCIKFKGKGRHGGKERIVPLNDAALSAFRAAHRKLGEDRVFWQVKSTYTIDSAWQTARKTLGLEKFTIHNFRSNYATWLVRKGMSIYKVMQIMGWEDYQTAKVYLGFSRDFIEEDRNLVNF